MEIERRARAGPPVRRVTRSLFDSSVDITAISHQFAQLRQPHCHFKKVQENISGIGTSLRDWNLTSEMKAAVLGHIRKRLGLASTARCAFSKCTAACTLAG